MDIASKQKAVPTTDAIKDHIRYTLPINTELYEKHRMKSIIGILNKLLHNELRFHCMVVEEISTVLTELHEIETGP
jgi:hypothetical protein